jgi:hypothetical protein
MALSILLLVAVDCGTIAAAPAYGNFQSNEVIIRSGAVGGRHRPAVPTAAVAVFPAAEMQAYRSADAPNGYYQVRIPAIVLAGRTLIAMGECARCQPGCKAAIGWSADLCSKISTDGGRTFPSATFQVIAVNGSQPDLVYDREHKQAVLNFCRDRTGDWPKGGLNMQIQSTDGVSWSAPRHAAAVVAGTAKRGKWSGDWFATFPRITCRQAAVQWLEESDAGCRARRGGVVQ